MKERGLHEIPCIESKFFPVSVSYCEFNKPGNAFPNHWHDHLEFLYVQCGEGVFECGLVPYHVKKGDLVIVNSGELHCGYGISGVFSYYCIIVDPALVQSSYTDACDIKYISPITNNLIVFNNNVTNDSAILDSINRIINEYTNQSIGYELSIKSDIYRTLVLLMRNHIRSVLKSDIYEHKKKELERLDPVFEYIEENYAEKITGQYLAGLINMSHYHFCHIFKQTTDKTITDYINSIRINKSIDLLFNTNMNITEISLATGFSDINYFIRLFKRHIGLPPSAFRYSIQASKGSKEI